VGADGKSELQRLKRSARRGRDVNDVVELDVVRVEPTG
jgi:hypothetical protein